LLLVTVDDARPMYRAEPLCTRLRLRAI